MYRHNSFGTYLCTEYPRACERGHFLPLRKAYVKQNRRVFRGPLHRSGGPFFRFVRQNFYWLNFKNVVYYSTFIIELCDFWRNQPFWKWRSCFFSWPKNIILVLLYGPILVGNRSRGPFSGFHHPPCPRTISLGGSEIKSY